MFKKIISNRRVATIAISVVSLFAITMALRRVGLYEGMKNKEEKEGMENKEEEEEKEAMKNKKASAKKANSEKENMKSTKVTKVFVPE